jgi:hypothetical protein
MNCVQGLREIAGKRQESPTPGAFSHKIFATDPPASHLALALAVHQEAVILLLFLGEGVVFLFIQETVQRQAHHVFPVGTAREVNFTVFMHIGLGHPRLLEKVCPAQF